MPANYFFLRSLLASLIMWRPVVFLLKLSLPRWALRLALLGSFGPCLLGLSVFGIGPLQAQLPSQREAPVREREPTQDSGQSPQESFDSERSPVQEPPPPDDPYEDGPSRRTLRREARKERIQQVGLQWGLPLETLIPLRNINNNTNAFRPSVLAGIHLKTQSDYRYAYTDADFTLGASFGYSQPPAAAMQRLGNHQLFRLGPKLDRPRSKLPTRYRGLRFYVGGGFQISHYSVHTGLSGTSTAFLDLRAIASLALINNVGSVSTLREFAREPRSPNSLYRRNYKKNIYHSWGLIFDIFSVGIGDHSEQNIFENPSFLISDMFAVEFFYARLFLKENQGNRSSSHQWTYRWKLIGQLVTAADTPFLFNSLNISFETIISYSWRWSWRQY